MLLKATYQNWVINCLLKLPNRDNFFAGDSQLHCSSIVAMVKAMVCLKFTLWSILLRLYKRKL